jgi:hypothetical protein
LNGRAALSLGIVAAALAAGALSCQWLIDLGGLSNGHCDSGFKLCGGQCVSTSDPNHGCGDLGSCAPCSLLNAYTTCDPETRQCSFSGCVAHYEHCSLNPADGGCPIDLEHNADHCGTCARSCPTPSNGVAGCAGGVCAVGSCDQPYEDCDRDPGNGCETNLSTDSAHCGSCGHACDAGTCSRRVCSIPDAGAD